MESDVSSAPEGGIGRHEKQLTLSQKEESGEGILLPRDSRVDPTISVILPTLNEEEGVAECIERIKEGLRKVGLRGEVILSDSSTDRTPEIGREMGAHVVHPDEEGYGYAYRYAFEYVRGEFVVIGDADATYDFSELPRLLKPILDGEADICMGSRLEGEIKPGAMPALHRYVGNPLLTWFLNFFYDAGVSDAHSGFRVFHRDVIDELELYTDGMEFASEMVMEAASKDLTIEEVPIKYHERKGEATLDSFHDGWRHVKFMLVNAPGYLFSVPAVIIGTLGITAITLSSLNVSGFGVFFGEHTMIAGSLMTILGMQIGSLGVFSSIAANPIREPRDPVTIWIRHNFRLEHGTSLGLLAFLIGASAIGWAIIEWISSGYTAVPSVNLEMVGFTAIVIGTQMIFSAFFLSVLSQERNGH